MLIRAGNMGIIRNSITHTCLNGIFDAKNLQYSDTPKEEFKPIHAGEVGMYVCGITVYDLCHIGHGRTFVAFDVVARYLRFLGYKLKYVRNITDIDDKIIKRANENGESFVALVDRMIAEMHKDFDALNILRPDMEPRATHHIAEIIELTEQLIAKGHAYVADNGDVMFDVPTDQLMACCRVRISTSCRLARALTWLMTNATRWTSFCGRCRKRANRAGRLRGARVVPLAH